MNATLKFGINTHELMPNGEVLFLIRQKLMKRIVGFKKKMDGFVPKHCTIRFELASRTQYFERSDCIIFAHQIAEMFGTKVRWHNEVLIPIYGTRPNLIIHVTLTDEG